MYEIEALEEDLFFWHVFWIKKNYKKYTKQNSDLSEKVKELTLNTKDLTEALDNAYAKIDEKHNLLDEL